MPFICQGGWFFFSFSTVIDHSWASVGPNCIIQRFCHSKGGWYHIRRFQKYFIHINIYISSSTLQFLQCWYQNGVNYLFLIVKSIEVTSGFISKVMKKIARWHHHWNISNLIVKTKISLLVVCYQGSNGCQKNHQNLKNLDLEVYCSNIQLNLTKLWSSTKNQSPLMASGGLLKFLQYWLNISAITQQIYL